MRDMYAEGCRQLSIVAGQAMLLNPRNRRTNVPFNWPRLSLAGLARKVFATSSVGCETRAAIEAAAQADDTALGLVELD